jgi:hypothetical protein
MSQEARTPLSMRAGVSLSTADAARVPAKGVVEPSIPCSSKGSVPVGVGSAGSEGRGEGLTARELSRSVALRLIFWDLEKRFDGSVCECGHVDHSHGESGLCEVAWGCDCPGFMDVDRGEA